jgi:hypothetical protein
VDVKRIGWGLLLLALLLTGTRPALAAQDFVYVHDRGAPNQVYAYQLGRTGSLAPVAGSPFQTSAGNTAATVCRGHCQTAAYSSKLKLLFVTGTAGISVMRVGTDGALTEVAGSPFGPTGDYVGISVYQKGRSTWVYASEPFGARLRGFLVGSTGALTEIAGSPFTSGAVPVVVAAVKGKLFTIAQGAQVVASYKIGSTGGLTHLFNTGVGTSGAFTFNVDPTGKTVYVPESVSGNEVLGFKAAASGQLSALPGSPFPSDAATGAGLVFGKPFLFTMAFSTTVTTDMQVYRRAGSGTLTKVGTRSSGLAGVRAGAVKTNRLVLASDDGDAVRSYIVGKDGSLTVADTEAAPIGFANAVVIVFR